VPLCELFMSNKLLLQTSYLFNNMVTVFSNVKHESFMGQQLGGTVCLSNNKNMIISKVFK